MRKRANTESRTGDNLHDVATGALHIHEVRVRRLYKSLQFVLPRFDNGVGVQKIGLQGRHRKGVGGSRRAQTKVQIDTASNMRSQNNDEGAE